jgi:hypothetical protein
LQAITQLFKENRLAKGMFIGLNRKLDLRNIICPLYLLAGDARADTRRDGSLVFWTQIAASANVTAFSPVSSKKSRDPTTPNDRLWS